jgi:monoamine oxidase
MVGPWLSRAGVADLDAAEFAAAREGEDWLVPDGYGRLVARSGAGLPVRLGCPVTSIRTLPGRIELATAQGVLTADQAIVTVPLGVLVAGRLRFDPPPPPAILAAIEALPMGDLVKLRVRLAGDPFGARDGFYASAPPAAARPSSPPRRRRA